MQNQYTGRENDGTGLYYNRERYNSPTYDRFISEDRLGLLAGVNEYAYADGDPMNLSDPLGLIPTMQFPLPIGAPTDLGALATEQQAAQALQAAQYHAMQIEYQAAQCLSRLFVAEYHQYKAPFQEQIGPVEELSSIGGMMWAMGKHSGEAVGQMGLEDAATAESMAGNLAGAAKLTFAADSLKFVGKGFFVLGAGLDLGSGFDATYFTIVNASSCCSSN
ncbi:MAG: RHS repeat-associated core domain-containing protein [Gammaproteobacteria bacterium]